MNSIEILEGHNAHRRGDAVGQNIPAVITQAIDECIKAAKRYELVRTLTPLQIEGIYVGLVTRFGGGFGGADFDAIIDELIKLKGGL